MKIIFDRKLCFPIVKVAGRLDFNKFPSWPSIQSKEFANPTTQLLFLIHDRQVISTRHRYYAIERELLN